MQISTALCAVRRKPSAIGRRETGRYSTFFGPEAGCCLEGNGSISDLMRERSHTFADCPCFPPHLARRLPSIQSGNTRITPLKRGARVGTFTGRKRSCRTGCQGKVVNGGLETLSG